MKLWKERVSDWEFVNRALNRWDAAKHKVWVRVGNTGRHRELLDRCDPRTYHEVCVALAGIGRNGWRAVKSMDLLETYVDRALVEECAEKAQIALNAAERADERAGMQGWRKGLRAMLRRKSA